MRKIIFLILTLPITTIFAQHTITGTFPNHANEQIVLEGFDGFSTYTIDSGLFDENGSFMLSYSPQDHGMGYLMAGENNREENKPFIIVLSGEDIRLEGKVLSMPETIEIVAGKQNQIFGQYATEHPRREQALSAWIYLEKIYRQDSLFSVHENPQTSIEAEKRRIREEDASFLSNLDPDSYISWFLPVRKLVSSVSTIAQYRTDEIPATIKAFRELDYTDPRLYKSGLLRETIEAHFWLIENSGRSLDSVFVEMNISIDYMIRNLMSSEQKLNEIADYLFHLLEKRSLFGSSEYLALKLLNEANTLIHDKLAAQLEIYRTMKKGNTAPDIIFAGDLFKNGEVLEKTGRLSDIDADFTLLVFGSAWCPMCAEELLQIDAFYDRWNSVGMEVVYISLDEEKEEFKESASGFPFLSFSDYQSWESAAVKDYHVFATPTMFLLDRGQQIILRPNSVKQMDAWVDWVLVQGN